LCNPHTPRPLGLDNPAGTLPQPPALDRPIAHLLYAAAKTEHPLSDRFLLSTAQHLSHAGAARLTAATGADLAQLSWGLARMGVWQPELQQLLDEVRARVAAVCV
jgi:hypothetical protein